MDINSAFELPALLLCRACHTGAVLTVFGATAVGFMMLMYALEHRGRVFVLAFALGCALSSMYGFLAGTWPFGVVEAIWSLIALRRYLRLHPARRHPPQRAEQRLRRPAFDERS